MINVQRRKLNAFIAASAVAAPWALTARAQERPVFLYLTVPPGTSIDASARVVAEKLRARLNRNVVVESRAGGGGVVAVQALKQVPPDGSALLYAPTTVVSLHSQFSEKPMFDAERDLSPVCEVAGSPHTITVNQALGVQTYDEFLALLRKDPKLRNVGTPSLTGLATLMVYQLGKSANLDLQHVPFRGGQPLLADLLGNQIPAASSVLADYLQEHRSGRLRVLGIAADARSPLAPSVPTFKELGHPVREAKSVFGLFARKGTPDALVEDYAKHVNEILAMPDVVQRMANIGLSPHGGTPEQYARIVRAESQDWAPVIKESGIRFTS
ncbi:tripartite tricarboxylate transporter substrate-binding protein [Hydrogenophaga sp.]|uniref:tripartite tricarboxylate transporter substrate-binding protein n=1 Tax=Hydrogenophaga sp. TaxID=1904254 RepID=UPI003F730BE7